MGIGLLGIALSGCKTPSGPPATWDSAAEASETAYWRQDEAFPQAQAVARSGIPSPTPELDALAALSAATTPNLKLSAILTPGSTAAPPIRLRPGDELEVVVYDRPEFSGTRRVGPDGTVPLFLVGSLRLEGLTEGEAGRIVSKALLAHLKQAQVQIWIKDPAGQQAQVIGRVRKPGAIDLPANRRLSVVGLLALSGGLDEDADGSQLTLVRRNSKGKQECYHFTHQELIAAHLAGREAWIEPEDELIVPRLSDVFVYGAVSKLGSHPLRPKTTVAALLLRAGGLDERANAREIQIMDGEKITPAELEKPLSPGQVVFVPKRQRVYMVGRGIRENGPIDIPSTGLTVVQAIAEAGWFTKRANLDSVEILRYRGRRQERIEVPFEEILDGEVSESDYVLQPGDLVRVSEDLF
ncbi:MAG: SLBB domain-containing protein [Planctomycetes bacterium]|nr:SLBB domain-containing protein [Planctomycetota bacterium]